MKKLLSAFVIMLIFGAMPLSGLASKVGNSYFSDDFQNETDWASLASYGWGSSNGGPVTIGTEGDNKYLNIVTPWGSSISKVFTQPLTGFVGIKMDVAINDPSISHFGFFDANEGTQNLLYFYKDSNTGVNKMIFAPTWSDLSFEIIDNEWVNVEMLVDVGGNKCSMWMTKQGGTKEAVFLNRSINLSGGLKGIVFNYPMHYPSSEGANFKLDNVDIYRDVVEESESFDNAAVIGDAIGWTSTNNPGVSIATEGNNRFLKINSLWENIVTKAFITPYGEPLTIEMKLKAQKPAGQFLRIIDQTGAYHNVLFFNQSAEGKNEIIYAYNGAWVTSPVSFDSDTWMNLKFIIDLKTKKWGGYISSDINGTRVDQALFTNSSFGMDGVSGIQFYYPMHYPADGLDFCIDEVKISLYSEDTIPDFAYNLNGSIEIDENIVNSSAQLYDQKSGGKATVKIVANRMFNGNDFATSAYYALYQDDVLIDIKKGDITFEMGSSQADITFDADLSRITSTSLKAKVFLWYGDNYLPLSSADAIIE